MFADKTQDILQSHRHFVLNTQEWQQFTATLKTSPEPNAALQIAWHNYKAIGLDMELGDD